MLDVDFCPITFMPEQHSAPIVSFKELYSIGKPNPHVWTIQVMSTMATLKVHFYHIFTYCQKAFENLRATYLRPIFFLFSFPPVAVVCLYFVNVLAKKNTHTTHAAPQTLRGSQFSFNNVIETPLHLSVLFLNSRNENVSLRRDRNNFVKTFLFAIFILCCIGIRQGKARQFNARKVRTKY